MRPRPVAAVAGSCTGVPRRPVSSEGVGVVSPASGAPVYLAGVGSYGCRRTRYRVRRARLISSTLRETGGFAVHAVRMFFSFIHKH